MNSVRSEEGRVASFLARFPRQSYVTQNASPEVLGDFFNQISQINFNAESPPKVVLRFLVSKEYLFGWVPVLSTGMRASPSEFTISQDLIEGWRRLGLVNDQGRFDFSVSPTTIRDRFRQVTGWSTNIKHHTLYFGIQKKSDERILDLRLNDFLNQTVVLDDLVDYVFILPLMTHASAREILQGFARLSARKVRGGGLGVSKGEQFFAILMQESIRPGAPLYGAGPLIKMPSEIPNLAEAYGWLKSLRAMQTALEGSDQPHRAHIAANGGVNNAWAHSAFFHLKTGWPIGHLSDWMIRGVASHLDKIFNIHKPLLDYELEDVKSLLPSLIGLIEKRLKNEPEISELPESKSFGVLPE